MVENEVHWLIHLLYLAGYLLALALVVRIVMLQRPAGVTFAWILVVLLLPYVGALAYLLIGERRLGETRSRRASAIHRLYEDWLDDLKRRFGDAGERLPERHRPLVREAIQVTGLPPMPGNRLQLLDHYEAIFRAMIGDIDQAVSYCHLEFYIWSEGGLADELAQALLRARQRGVVCRVQLDAVGSKPFLQGKWARRLREGGVELVEALPVSPLRLLFRRMDLRNHRKIMVIDGRVGYTGSQNLVDPRFFKQQAGVGEWIDVMIRAEGPVLEALIGVVVEDWQQETGRALEVIETYADNMAGDSGGSTPVQVIPSGPSYRYMAIHQLLTTVLYSARRELLLVTPYFVPDDTLKLALMSAAQRGVEVTLLVPERVDSLLVRYASRSLFDDLLAVGVRVAQFRGGLLHTKAIIVDGGFTVLGSVNMDMRSLWLNFEISLFVYDRDFTRRTRQLIRGYLADSRFIDAEAWRQRPARQRLVENLARLVGPLL